MMDATGTKPISERALVEVVKKRSVVVGAHKSSVSLEDVFWYALNAIAKQRGIFKCTLLEKIDNERGDIGLSSAIRQFVLRVEQGESGLCGS